MEHNTTPLGTLFKRAEEYGNTTIELIKLNAIDKSADVVSSLVSRLAIILTVSLSLLIVNIGFAFWIGKILGDYFYGFFIVGGFYAIVAFLLHTFRHQWIKNPVSNSIIKQMLKKKIIAS